MQSNYPIRAKRAAEYLLVFLLGGVTYATIELCWRGFSHWSMALAGGVSLCGIYFLEGRLGRMPLLLKCLCGGVLITLVELAFGCALNLLLHWDIWDYSDQPFQFMGQICLTYSLLWTALSLPAFLLCARIRRVLGAPPKLSLPPSPEKSSE